ncbi:hypothetical protein BJY04DRAFT_187872 [Aspergillus karnatakaensis]|uniref:uncharacterized protein n=1 Tax=Aspergillus karnatakaensis TaxID=1810916 RepID=UPI003CCCB113
MPPSQSPATPKPTPSTSQPSPSASKPKTTLLRLLNYTVFTFLAIILLCLIVLTPADAIYQCYVTHRLTNIFIITGGYIVTFLLAVLIYATRIYTNRTVLGGIPKAWIPVEREDVGKSVRRLVVEGLGRSALIAAGVRPRDLNSSSGHGDAGDGGDGMGNGVGEEGKGLLRGFDFEVNPGNPPWGVIEHAGWSAPGQVSGPTEANASPAEGEGGCENNSGLPAGLCYRTVIRELPHLIEAKAVSLAPPDPFFSAPNPHQDEEHRIPDTRVVEILRRPAAASLRQYITHLSQLSVLNPPETSLEFLALYEQARFSGRDLYESEFRELMRVFADLLRGMRFDIHEFNFQSIGLSLGMSPDGVSMRDTNSIFGSQTNSESVIGPSDEEGETETDGETNTHHSRSRAQSRSSRYGYHFANEYLDGAGSSHAHRDIQRGRSRSALGNPQMQWLPLQEPQPPRTPWVSASASTHSLRPVRSNVSIPNSTSGRSFGSGSGSGGSVIRLADAGMESGLGVPYVFEAGPSP